MSVYGQCTVNSLLCHPGLPTASYMTGLVNITGWNAAQNMIGLRLGQTQSLGIKYVSIALKSWLYLQMGIAY